MTPTPQDHPALSCTCFQALGYPLNNLPPAGSPLTSLALRDTLRPLLEGVRATLDALAPGLTSRALDDASGAQIAIMLEGQVACALHLLERWWADQQREDTADGQC